MEDNKATITASEEELVKMVEKIRHNRIEDMVFVQQLDSFLYKNSGRTSALTVSDTPYALAVSGANNQLPVVIRPNTILKCMSKPEERFHGHDLDFDIMQRLPQELRNPTLVFKGNIKDSLVVITQLKDNQNQVVMIALSLNDVVKRQEVNRVSSVYGKNKIENYLRNQINLGNLIAVNKEKADKMFQSLGLQLPPEETFISYNNSIAYTTANVKGKEQNFRKNNLKLFINRGESLFFDNDKINALLLCDADTLKSLAERTYIFSETNATFEDMHNDYFTKLFSYADFYPNGEVEAWLSLQSATYGYDFYDVPLKDSEKEMLLNDLDDIAVGEGASVAQWLKDIPIEVQEVQKPISIECTYDDNQSNGRGR